MFASKKNCKSCGEVVCGARFSDVFVLPRDESQMLGVDVDRLHDYEPYQAEPSGA